MAEIVHKGIVRKVENDQAEIELVDAVSCESCSAQGACQAGDLRDKVLRIQTGSREFRVGQLVEVEMSTGMAFSALFWAYLFPFLLMLVGLVIGAQYVGELLSATVALGILAIYYILVYLNRAYFEKKFELKVNTSNHD